MAYRTSVVDGKARLVVPAADVSELPDGSVAIDFEPDEGRYAGWHLDIVAWAAGGRKTGDDAPKRARVAPGLNHAVRISVGTAWADLPLEEAEAFMEHIREAIALQHGHIAAGTTSSASMLIPRDAP